MYLNAVYTSMAEQLHTVYEIQKMLLGTPLSLAMGADQNARIGTLVSEGPENKKIFQQLRQPDVATATTVLSTTTQKSLVLPAHVFWPMVRNVAYIYTIKVITLLDYIKGEFKFNLPKSDKFDVGMVLLKDAKIGSMHRYTFQMIIQRNGKGGTTEFFTNFMAKDQAELVCTSKIAMIKLSMTPHPVVLGPLPPPCLLDIKVESNKRSVSARFNSDSYDMLKTYFLSVRKKLDEHFQRSQQNYYKPI